MDHTKRKEAERKTTDIRNHMPGPTSAAVLYCRIPGLIAGAARTTLPTHPDGSGLRTVAPVVVAEGRVVRDACPEAARYGAAEGMAITRARRLCPHLIAIPIEAIDSHALREQSHILLDALSDLSPVVEPGGGPETAYADLRAAGGVRCQDAAQGVARDLYARLRAALPGTRDPLIAVGPSRLAARALAECGSLHPGRLPDCDTRWLWPEDPSVTARLFRLGLTTFGAVAGLPESALVYQFGIKLGPLLWRRARGRDMTPVRALYPEPRVEAVLDFSLDPVSDGERLQEALRQLAGRVAGNLNFLGRHARRVSLWLAQESAGHPDFGRWADSVVPAPIQNERDLVVAVHNLLRRFVITSPVTCLRLAAADLDLPAAASGDLFQQRSQGDRRTVAAARRMLTARYGTKTLRPASELPVERRDRRRTLVRSERMP